MPRPTLTQLESLCQKPDHCRIGNWMARRVSRPAALRITWVIAPWGISANAITLAAWGVGIGAAAAFGWGTLAGWLVGAGLLQLWYLLDHVDGQLARLHGTASLDGVQLDYLMHHTVNLVLPLGIGFGLFARSAEPWWLLAGLVWGVALLLIGLGHDTRYKAFIGRLQRVRGRLTVHGGGGGRPEAQPPIPSSVARLLAWTARKASETHVVMNVLGLLAVVQLGLGDIDLLIGRVYLATMALVAMAVAVWSIGRSQSRHEAEREFAAWYRVAPGSDLTFSEGWWTVSRQEDRQDSESTQPATLSQEQSS